MQKLLIGTIAITAILVGAFYLLNQHIYNEKQQPAAPDFKDAEYLIEGQRIQLSNGVAQTEAAPGSAAKLTTRYFGNELITDLNADGRDDVAFILTQETGGSGVFYYGVAAIQTDKGYVGTEAYFLGDRIAPQSTTLSPNPRHKQVIVFNYADRGPADAMSTPPSIGKSVYLKLDGESLRWAIVEPDFEGEAR